MDFFLFSLSFMCFMLSADIAMYVHKNYIMELPRLKFLQFLFVALSFVAGTSWLWAIGFGIYQFGFLFSIGVVAIGLIGTVMIRPLFAGRNGLYMASIALAIVGLIAFSIVAMADSQPTFKGFACTDDCSGHVAGYQWARSKGLIDIRLCATASQSFNEGCAAFVLGR